MNAGTPSAEHHCEMFGRLMWLEDNTDRSSIVDLSTSDGRTHAMTP